MAFFPGSLVQPDRVVVPPPVPVDVVEVGDDDEVVVVATPNLTVPPESRTPRTPLRSTIQPSTVPALLSRKSPVPLAGETAVNESRLPVGRVAVPRTRPPESVAATFVPFALA